MRELGLIHLLSLVTAATILCETAVATPCAEHHVEHPESGLIHLPITRRTANNGLRKRAGTGQIGLGDSYDASYSVELKIGSVSTSFTLDTGSSDLWAVADTCTGNCKSQVPLYPSSSFQSSGIGLSLFYGDSQTGTSAFGLIGKDVVSLAGLAVQDQYFAAINRTNTSVLDGGDIGIFGLGFPINSDILQNSFAASASQGSLTRRRRDLTLGSAFLNYGRRYIPSFVLQSPSTGIQSRQSATNATASATASGLVKSFSTFGNFLGRLVLSGSLASPQYTVTVQRDTVQIGGNAGVLTLGGLPSGVKNESLTWVPVRLYTSEEGGIPGPTEAPNEVYPLNWEIPIDDVYLDGNKLPRSSLVPSNISISALLDTGNSLIRGPPDSIQLINDTIGSTFLCSTPHTLSFQIGGKMFPVDARDFASALTDDSSKTCSASISATDVPTGTASSFFYSWSLGDPFLRSVLASFYFGNITNPSRDLPRVGLLSTVPSNDGDQLKSAVASAAKGGLTFTKERAPTGAPVATQTNSVGVLQAPTQATASQKSAASSNLISSNAVLLSMGAILIGLVLVN